MLGDGPIELVFVGPMVSHVELSWALPENKAFMEQLATFCRIVVFDKAGLGLSDPVPNVRTLDDRAAKIEAAMVFAATRPQRTRALILCGSYSTHCSIDGV